MKGESPIISFIIAVYNGEKYISRAVNSILRQNQENVEIIIVDDGSTDSTPQIIDKYDGDYECIHAVHQKNQWIYASFNNGIRMASGEYIYILNSDDKISENALDILIKKIDEFNHPDVIWTKVISFHCDENQNKLSSNSEEINSLVDKELYITNPKDIRANWPYLIKSGLAWNQANLYKRKIALDHPFRNDVYGADTLFNTSIVDDIRNCVVLMDDIYEFNIYDNNSMNTSINKYYSYEHEMFNEIYQAQKDVMCNWIDEEEYLPWLKRTRRMQFTSELKNLNSPSCKLSVEEKIRDIFERYLDDIIIEIGDDKEEMECRTLSGLREIFTRDIPSKECEYYFCYELLESLLRYEKTTEDIEKIHNAINHPKNKLRIGSIFLKDKSGPV